jgi:hypothetical protein
MIFYVGSIWRPKITITDSETNTPVDPTTVTATVTKPDQTSQTPEVSKLDTGVYTTSITLTEPGRWHLVINGTGAHQCAAPESITVQPD